MKPFFTILVFLGYLFFSSLHIFAQGIQEQEIKGDVTDEKGSPLPGVTVKGKNSAIAVITNGNGEFFIKIPLTVKTLILSSIGMQSQEILVGKKGVIHCVLKNSTTTLNDIVVIGYGSQKKGDVNGAISSVSAKEIENIPQVSIDQLLQGKASGVTITQNSGAPGSQTSVHIRGITSLSLSNEPLYVIDGIPVSGDANNQATSGQSVAALNGNNYPGESGVSPLSLLNPSDIESIQILKDASASAIYGSQASNGVVMITTKHGKVGSPQISYDGYLGTQEQGKFLPLMTLPQYANLENALADNEGLPRRVEFANPSLLGPGTDWQKAIFKSATEQNHQISISGGKLGTDFYISGGYLKQDGTIIGNNFQRYSFRSNINSQVKDWLKFGTTLSGSRSYQNASISNNYGIVYLALLAPPDEPVYNADGSFAGPPANQENDVNKFNPVASALSITNLLERSNLSGSAYAELKIFKDLTLRSEVNGDFNFGKQTVFNPTYTYGANTNSTNKLQEYQPSSNYWAWKEYFSYKHIFAKKHDLQATLGHEVNSTHWNGTTESIQNFLSNDLQTLNLGTAKTAIVNEYKDASSLESYFARSIYTYANKYSLTATIRSDRSSKFAYGHQIGYFPAFGLSWRVSEEGFMKNAKEWASNVKLRLGYGQVGNQNVPNYLYGAALNSINTGLGTGFYVDKVQNPGLTWETAIQSNLGIDFTILKDRVEGSFDVYDKTSKNFLFQTPLPAFVVGGSAEYSPYGSINPPYINGGKISNRGFEFNITSHNIQSKSFSWNTTIIFSHYKNKVLSLASGVPFINGNLSVGFLNFTLTKTQAGGPVGEFFGYKSLGTFKTTDQLASAPIQFGQSVQNSGNGTWLGDIQYEDTNHDGVVDAKDQVPIGDPNPKFTYAITNTFAFKGIDLSIFLNGSYGAKIDNVLNYQIAGLGQLYANQLASVSSFWSPTNSSSNIPAPRNGNNPNLYPSDRFIESGSYLRVQNVTLGYTFPSNLIHTIRATQLKIYVSGQNLWVFTPYKGLDPEIGANNQGVFLSGIDIGRYPSPRIITAGIKVQF